MVYRYFSICSRYFIKGNNFYYLRIASMDKVALPDRDVRAKSLVLEEQILSFKV